jgi:cytosine/adenosine deaminase-related metal-dependent hydrolase
LSGKAGELSAGAFADLIAIPFTDKISRLPETALAHTGKVAASMIAGRWAISPA